MSDLELTDHESDRLRELLHRRADRIQVTTPQFDVVSPTHDALRRGNGRWFAAAAAAVVVLAAVGGAWWLSSDGTDRIDSVPAEPTVTVAPQVLEEAGIWRLAAVALPGAAVLAGRSVACTLVFSVPLVPAPDTPGDPEGDERRSRSFAAALAAVAPGVAGSSAVGRASVIAAPVMRAFTNANASPPDLVVSPAAPVVMRP